MIHPNKPRKTSCIAHALAILLIPLLFIIGLFLAYFGFISLKVEIHTLGIVLFIFFIFIFFIKHNANYVVCHMKASFSHMDDTLDLALRQNTLSIMGKEKSTLDIKTFYANYYAGLRNDHFAHIATSIFPMLGILGTFIAIALSMPDFTVQDTASLDHEISLLLSGIGTAFYASIYGIMLSLIWTYFEKRGMTKVDKQIMDLEKIYHNRIWEKSELIKHQHMQADLKDQHIIQTLKEIFDIDFIKNYNQEYLQNFTSIMQESSHNFSQLATSMQEAYVNLEHTLDKIEDKNNGANAVTVMLDNMSSFNQNAQHLQKSMERFDQSVHHTFTMIDKELAQSIEKLRTFSMLLSEQNAHKPKRQENNV